MAPTWSTAVESGLPWATDRMRTVSKGQTCLRLGLGLGVGLGLGLGLRLGLGIGIVLRSEADRYGADRDRCGSGAEE